MQEKKRQLYLEGKKRKKKTPSKWQAGVSFDFNLLSWGMGRGWSLTLALVEPRPPPLSLLHLIMVAGRRVAPVAS